MEQDVKIASGHGFLAIVYLCAKKSEQFYRAKFSTLGKILRSCEIPTPKRLKPFRGKKKLQYQHRVAVTEKPVSLFYGFPVSFEYKFFSRKCAHQKEQCRFW